MNFYYDAQRIHYRIIPSIGDPNHPVVYHERATTAKDPGHTVQQVEVVNLQSIVEVSNTLRSSLGDMNSRILLESM
jgi:hypothetical protein